MRLGFWDALGLFSTVRRLRMFPLLLRFSIEHRLAFVLQQQPVHAARVLFFEPFLIKPDQIPNVLQKGLIVFTGTYGACQLPFAVLWILFPPLDHSFFPSP